jgi:CheY-like chemotaxis protein
MSVRKKILLVDDAATALLVERALLRDAPYDIVTARSGAEAVEKAALERPDLILMDVVMPGMTGLDACAALRKREATQAIPIIIVTTRGSADHFEAGYRSGCTDYMTKPISPVELRAKLRAYLGE